MSIDLSLWEESQVEGFDDTVANGDYEEYQNRLNTLIGAVEMATVEELPQRAWILCWTKCFGEYLECLLNAGYGMPYAMCVTRYNHCIDNCGPIQA